MKIFLVRTGNGKCVYVLRWWPRMKLCIYAVAQPRSFTDTGADIFEKHSSGEIAPQTQKEAAIDERPDSCMISDRRCHSPCAAVTRPAQTLKHTEACSAVCLYQYLLMILVSIGFSGWIHHRPRSFLKNNGGVT